MTIKSPNVYMSHLINFFLQRAGEITPNKLRLYIYALIWSYSQVEATRNYSDEARRIINPNYIGDVPTAGFIPILQKYIDMMNTGWVHLDKSKFNINEFFGEENLKTYDEIVTELSWVVFHEYKDLDPNEAHSIMIQYEQSISHALNTVRTYT